MRYILGSVYYLYKLYIGLVFILTLIFFYPLLWVVLQFDSLKSFSFRINIMWSRCMRIFCFYAVELEGESRSKLVEPFVLIGNHTSYLDIFLLYSILPKNKFLFMGKSELLNYPLVKTFFKKLNIPVDRNSVVKSAKAFITARKAIQNGWSIVVFPEGGIIDPTPTIAPFKNGAFQLALSAKSPILPITFKNNFRLFSDPSYFLFPAMPGLVKIYIHPVIPAEEVINNSIETMKEKSYVLIQSILSSV